MVAWVAPWSVRCILYSQPAFESKARLYCITIIKSKRNFNEIHFKKRIFSSQNWLQGWSASIACVTARMIRRLPGRWPAENVWRLQERTLTSVLSSLSLRPLFSLRILSFSPWNTISDSWKIDSRFLGVKTLNVGLALYNLYPASFFYRTHEVLTVRVHVSNASVPTHCKLAFHGEDLLYRRAR